MSVKLSDVISPSFYDLYSDLKTERPQELWLVGGRGSTKSTFASVLAQLELTRDQLAHAFVTRRYDNELRDTVYGQCQWASYHLGIEHVWRYMTSPMQAVHEVTKQKILFRGADNPLKSKSINLGKGFIKIAWFEEVDQYSGMAEIRNILQSIFRGDGEDQLAIFSYNPPRSMRAWVNQETAIEKPGRRVHRSDYRSVPRKWLGERFLAEAEHLKKTNPAAYEHEYLGIPTGTGLEVFNNVTLRAVTDEEKANFPETYQGLDFGYAADPTAFERTYFNPNRRTLYIYEEITGHGMLNRQFAERANAEHRRCLTMADSEAPKDIDELKLDHGFNVLGASKPKGSVEHGVKWLSELDSIVIDPAACPLAAKEFTNYALDRTKSGEVISRYPDRDNHSIDAVRYALSSFILYEAPEPRGEVVTLNVW